MYLIFDTETNTLPQFNLPHHHNGQARVIQLACLLLDHEFKEVASFYSLIKHDCIAIAEGAFKAHGISLGKLREFGIESELAMQTFLAFKEKATVCIAHNIKFDSFLLNVEQAQVGNPLITWKNPFCTMLASTPIVGLKRANSTALKWPKLSEAYEYFFHKKFEKAHDALADVRATAEVFRKLKELEAAVPV
jgi:DNA polymerase-3 subunit epsilon